MKTNAVRKTRGGNKSRRSAVKGSVQPPELPAFVPSPEPPAEAESVASAKDLDLAAIARMLGQNSAPFVAALREELEAHPELRGTTLQEAHAARSRSSRFQSLSCGSLLRLHPSTWTRDDEPKAKIPAAVPHAKGGAL